MNSLSRVFLYLHHFCIKKWPSVLTLKVRSQRSKYENRWQKDGINRLYVKGFIRVYPSGIICFTFVICLSLPPEVRSQVVSPDWCSLYLLIHQRSFDSLLSFVRQLLLWLTTFFSTVWQSRSIIIYFISFL